MAANIEHYQKQWLKEICLSPDKDAAVNFIDELEAYSGLPRPEVEKLFYNGTEAFAKEWESYRDAPEGRARFYDESFTQIFFVMHNSALRVGNSSPFLYLYARDMAKRLGMKRYLDYGAGTGSGALFFAKENIETTAADLSRRMLDFAEWRFKRRGFSARFLDMKKEALPEKTFDMITCFHVLQHVEDPLALMRQLRGALKEGGILIVNGTLEKDPERPMQPDHGGKQMTRKFRSVGLQILWKETSDMLRLSNTNPQVYRRVERSPFMNAAYLAYDTLLVSPTLRHWVFRMGKTLGVVR